MFEQDDERISLWGLIKEDWSTNGKDWTKPGFQALAVYRFGVWRMGFSSKVIRIPFSIMYKVFFCCVRNFYGIEIPFSAVIGRKVVLEHQHGIVVHGASVVGDGCILRQGVTLGNRRMTEPDAAPHLGVGVNVGAGAKILGAVRVGDKAQIGANSVVIKDVPAGHVVIGNPMKIIKPSSCGN